MVRSVNIYENVRVPSNPAQYETYAATVIGVFTGTYLGIARIIDPFHLPGWDDALDAHHHALFGVAMTRTLHAACHATVTAVSGTNGEDVVTPLGNQKAFDAALALAVRHAVTVLTAKIHAHTVLGLNDLSSVTLTDSLTTIATGLGYALDAAGLLGEPAR